MKIKGKKYKEISVSALDNIGEQIVLILDDVSRKIHQYIWDYYEREKPNFRIQRIRFFNGKTLPIEISYEDILNNTTSYFVSKRDLEKLITSDEKIAKYYDLINSSSIFDKKIRVYDQYKNFAPLTFSYHQDYLYYKRDKYKDTYRYECKMLTYYEKNLDQAVFIGEKQYQSLLNFIKEYELIELQYSDTINKDMRVNIYNTYIDTYSDGIKLDELRETFQNAIAISNLLLQNAFNDFFLTSIKNRNKNYIGGRYLAGRSFLALSDNFLIYNYMRDKKVNLFNTFILHKYNDFFDSILSKEEADLLIKESAIDTYNIMLLDEFLNILSEFSGIIYENNKSDLTGIDVRYLSFSFKYNKEEDCYFIEKEAIGLTDTMNLLQLNQLEKKVKLALCNNKTVLFSDWQKEYAYLVALVDKYSSLLTCKTEVRKETYKDKIKISTRDLFDDGKIKRMFLNNDILALYDLSDINFEGKNIAGLDISRNLEAKINFDKIAKDVSGCNFNGYDLKKVTFRDFNIKDVDFRNTSATIDLSNCAISFEGKMNTGTLFDEGNQLMYGDKKLSKQEIDVLHIKVYKKEM